MGSTVEVPDYVKEYISKDKSKLPKLTTPDVHFFRRMLTKTQNLTDEEFKKFIDINFSDKTKKLLNDYLNLVEVENIYADIEDAHKNKLITGDEQNRMLDALEAKFDKHTMDAMKIFEQADLDDAENKSEFVKITPDKKGLISLTDRIGVMGFNRDPEEQARMLQKIYNGKTEGKPKLTIGIEPNVSLGQDVVTYKLPNSKEKHYLDLPFGEGGVSEVLKDAAELIPETAVGALEGIGMSLGSTGGAALGGMASVGNPIIAGAGSIAGGMKGAKYGHQIGETLSQSLGHTLGYRQPVDPNAIEETSNVAQLLSLTSKPGSAALNYANRKIPSVLTYLGDNSPIIKSIVSKLGGEHLFGQINPDSIAPIQSGRRKILGKASEVFGPVTLKQKESLRKYMPEFKTLEDIAGGSTKKNGFPHAPVKNEVKDSVKSIAGTIREDAADTIKNTLKPLNEAYLNRLGKLGDIPIEKLKNFFDEELGKAKALARSYGKNLRHGESLKKSVKSVEEKIKFLEKHRRDLLGIDIEKRKPSLQKNTFSNHGADEYSIVDKYVTERRELPTMDAMQFKEFMDTLGDYTKWDSTISGKSSDDLAALARKLQYIGKEIVDEMPQGKRGLLGEPYENIPLSELRAKYGRIKQLEGRAESKGYIRRAKEKYRKLNRSEYDGSNGDSVLSGADNDKLAAVRIARGDDHDLLRSIYEQSIENKRDLGEISTDVMNEKLKNLKNPFYKPKDPLPYQDFPYRAEAIRELSPWFDETMTTVHKERMGKNNLLGTIAGQNRKLWKNGAKASDTLSNIVGSNAGIPRLLKGSGVHQAPMNMLKQQIPKYAPDLVPMEYGGYNPSNPIAEGNDWLLEKLNKATPYNDLLELFNKQQGDQ